jgi:Outer membrane lipoprotein-sorting protein
MKWSLLIVLISSSTYGATPDAQKLLRNWKDAMYTPQETSEIRMTITRPGKEKIEREAKVFYKSHNGQDIKILLSFTSPAKIRGTALLSLKKNATGPSDQWIYFPSYKKARRLSSRKSEDSFLDSDFSNGDISFQYQQGYTFKFLKEDTLADKKVFVLEGVATLDSPYARQLLYITQDTNLNTKTEFIDKTGKIIKEFIVKKWNQYGSQWAIDDALMRNTETKSETRIEFTKRETALAPADNVFTLTHLERGL